MTFECSICPAVFPEDRALQEHEQLHRQLESLSQDIAITVQTPSPGVPGVESNGIPGNATVNEESPGIPGDENNGIPGNAALNRDEESSGKTSIREDEIPGNDVSQQLVWKTCLENEMDHYFPKNTDNTNYTDNTDNTDGRIDDLTDGEVHKNEYKTSTPNACNIEPDDDVSRVGMTEGMNGSVNLDQHSQSEVNPSNEDSNMDTQSDHDSKEVETGKPDSEAAVDHESPSPADLKEMICPDEDVEPSQSFIKSEYSQELLDPIVSLESLPSPLITQETVDLDLLADQLQLLAYPIEREKKSRRQVKKPAKRNPPKKLQRRSYVSEVQEDKEVTSGFNSNARFIKVSETLKPETEHDRLVKRAAKLDSHLLTAITSMNRRLLCKVMELDSALLRKVTSIEPDVLNEVVSLDHAILVEIAKTGSEELSRMLTTKTSKVSETTKMNPVVVLNRVPFITPQILTQHILREVGGSIGSTGFRRSAPRVQRGSLVPSQTNNDLNNQEGHVNNTSQRGHVTRTSQEGHVTITRSGTRIQKSQPLVVIEKSVVRENVQQPSGNSRTTRGTFSRTSRGKKRGVTRGKIRRTSRGTVRRTSRGTRRARTPVQEPADDAASTTVDSDNVTIPETNPIDDQTTRPTRRTSTRSLPAKSAAKSVPDDPEPKVVQRVKRSRRKPALFEPEPEPIRSSPRDSRKRVAEPCSSQSPSDEPSSGRKRRSCAINKTYSFEDPLFVNMNWNAQRLPSKSTRVKSVVPVEVKPMIAEEMSTDCVQRELQTEKNEEKNGIEDIGPENSVMDESRSDIEAKPAFSDTETNDAEDSTPTDTTPKPVSKDEAKSVVCEDEGELPEEREEQIANGGFKWKTIENGEKSLNGEKSENDEKIENGGGDPRKRGQLLKCRNCGEEFASFMAITVHRRKDCNGSIQNYWCEFCSSTFEDRLAVIQHKNQNHICIICGTLVKHQGDLKEHVATHEGPFQCRICDKFYPGLRQIIHHGGKHLMYCKQTCCGERFVSQGRLHHHCSTVHPDQYQSSECVECGDWFPTRAICDEHSRYHSVVETSNDGKRCKRHGDGTVPSLDDVSDAQSTLHDLDLNADKHFANSRSPTKSETDKKRQTHLSLPSHKRQNCEQCSYTTTSSHRLHWHVVRNHTDKTHQCPHCDKTYAAQLLLRHHLRTHSDSKKAICAQCGTLFSDRKRLRIHVSKVHRLKRFKCKFCDKKFANMVGRFQHQVVHNRDRHECDNCSRQFTSEQALRIHKRVHTGEKPHDKC